MFPINESSIDSYLIIINFLSNEQKKKTCLSGTGCHRSIKKKTTRDVIADGVRWTEAMRVVRADHPEVTIIMPGEKIQVHPGDDVRRLITPYVAVIRQALDCKRVGEYVSVFRRICYPPILSIRICNLIEWRQIK